MESGLISCMGILSDIRDTRFPHQSGRLMLRCGAIAKCVSLRMWSRFPTYPGDYSGHPGVSVPVRIPVRNWQSGNWAMGSGYENDGATQGLDQQ
jgi:hypothetical protein